MTQQPFDLNTLQMFSKVKNKLSVLLNFGIRNRKKVLLFFAFFVIGSLTLTALFPDVALATKPGEINFGDFFIVDGWLRIISWLSLSLASLFVKMTLFFLTFIIQIAAYNGYLDATAVNVGWVMVRDLTNMFFVIILLTIAFGTILGVENYEWKKLLVKFILAAILVNYSRVIVGLLIDISQILMITFVNGIVATAGGNLINMFNLTRIEELHRDVTAPGLKSSGVFAASIAALTFAAIAMGTMLIFVFMLVARMIRLWILIILSPIAFVLGVLPNTANYAQQWWSELGDNLVTGPVLLFFIWLAFVTLGTGDINTEIATATGLNEAIIKDPGLHADAYGQQSAGPTRAMGWNDMASFAIAVGMLFAGARVASTIGGESGSALSKATDFGKKVATIASGYALGRFAYEKVAGGTMSGLKKAAGLAGQGLYRFPVVDLKGRVDRTVLAIKTEYNSMLGKYGKQQPLRPVIVKDGTEDGVKMVEKQEKEMALNEATGEMEETGRMVGTGEMQKVATKGKKVRVFNQETGEQEDKFVANGEEYMEVRDLSWWRSPVQKWSNKTQMKNLSAAKKYKKVIDFNETKEGIQNALAQGVPKSFLFTVKGEDVDAMDRRYQGILEQLQARSKAKTDHYKAAGAYLTSTVPRGQYKMESPTKYARKMITQGDELATHQIEAAKYKAMGESRQLKAKVRVLLGILPERGKDGKTKEREMVLNARNALYQEQAALAEVATLTKQFSGREDVAKTAFAKTEEGKKLREKRVEEVIDEEKQKHIIDDLENRTRLGLTGSEEYVRMLAAAATEAISKLALDSTEKSKADDTRLEHMDEALAVEKRAQEKLREADRLHSKDGQEKIDQANSLAAMLQNYLFTEQRLMQEMDSIDMDDADANAQVEAKEKELANHRKGLNADGTKPNAVDADGNAVNYGVKDARKDEEQIRQLRRNAKEDDKKMDTTQRDRKQDLEDEAEEIRQGSIAWRYAAAKAEEEESTLAYSVGHDKLLSKVEQAVVHDARGVEIPTLALTAPIERYGRNLEGMDYDMFASVLSTNAKAMSDKWKRKRALEEELATTDDEDRKRQIEEELKEKRNSVTDSDKAEMASLLAHGQKHDWLDDAIWAYWGSELQEDVKESLDWTDAGFDNKKINDIMAVYASGGDFEFARINSKISDMMDHAKKQMGMSLAAFYQKLEEGFTEKEEEILRSRFGDEHFDAATDKSDVQYYMDSIRSNQAQHQLISNMRDPASASTHSENGGHNQFLMLQNGETLFVPVGEQIADDNVMGEVRKQTVGVRAKMQTHATTDLDELSGYATLVREGNNTYVRGDINSANDQRGTNTRFKNQRSGLTAEAKKDEYITTEHGFLANGEKANGQMSDRHRWAQNSVMERKDHRQINKKTGRRGPRVSQKQVYDKIKSDIAHKVSMGGAATKVYKNTKGDERTLTEEQALQQETSNDIVANLFAPAMRTGMRDFLLYMGAQSGVDDKDALEGVMNMTVLVNGKNKKITHVNELIDAYNEGEFTWGDKPREIPQFTKEQRGKKAA